MRFMRALVAGAVVSICLCGHALAMGSGPHPHLLYGLPPTAPGPPNDGQAASAIWLMPIDWVIPSLAIAGLLLWALQAARKK